jgi:predicted acetyltransferase
MESPQAVVVNPIVVDDVPSWLRAMVGGFLEDPHGADARRSAQMLAAIWEPERAWGARDGGRWVATLRTETRTLTVPGLDGTTRTLPADAVTSVTVSATHRRRGLMSRMLDDSLRAAVDRGEAISILSPDEWPIYGRFGYAPATWNADYVLHRGRPGAIVAGDLANVRTSDRDEIARVGAAVFAAFARERAGQIDRDQRWWDMALGGDGFPEPTDADGLPHTWVVHEGPDGIDGIAGWRATRQGGLNPPRARIDVWGLFTPGDDAYRDLWAYLTGLDLTDEIALRERPVDEPARWLLDDGRSLVLANHVDVLWLRLLDVEAALTARRYATAGELVLEVHDDSPVTRIDVSGRYALHADGDTVQCARTARPADLELGQRALASIYLGAIEPAVLRAGGAVNELTPGALERARLMFSTPRAPWTATDF